MIKWLKDFFLCLNPEACGSARAQAFTDALFGPGGFEKTLGRPESVEEHRDRSHPFYKRYLAKELADAAPYKVEPQGFRDNVLVQAQWHPEKSEPKA